MPTTGPHLGDHCHGSRRVLWAGYQPSGHSLSSGESQAAPEGPAGQGHTRPRPKGRGNRAVSTGSQREERKERQETVFAQQRELGSFKWFPKDLSILQITPKAAALSRPSLTPGAALGGSPPGAGAFAPDHRGWILS